MDILPATLNIKVAPFQVLHFSSQTHTADENGLILNVPYDVATALIKDEQHPAVEATEDDLAKEAPLKIAEVALVPLEQSVAPIVPVPAPEPVIPPAAEKPAE
jgi:hypothetical protein